MIAETKIVYNKAGQRIGVITERHKEKVFIPKKNRLSIYQKDIEIDKNLLKEILGEIQK